MRMGRGGLVWVWVGGGPRACHTTTGLAPYISLMGAAAGGGGRGGRRPAGQADEWRREGGVGKKIYILFRRVRSGALILT